jgi:hypothetical protein
MTFNRLAAALLFIAIAMAACLMPAQNDTFWQLRAGQYVWTTGHLLYRDLFSHTAFGAYWPNHEWLTQVAFYAAYRLAGMPGLTLLCASAVVAGWALAWRVMRGSVAVRVAMVAIAMPAAATLWSLRPQALSLGFTGVVVWLVTTRRWWWVPPVLAVWANVHGGALLGVVLLGGAAGASLMWSRRDAPAAVLTCAAGAGAVCLTPLGVRWWPEMIVSLLRIRTIGIAEWQPASLLHLSDLPFWMTAVALAVVAWRSRRRLDGDSALLLGISAVTLPLAASAGRNISPFLLAALPALSRLLPDHIAAWEPALARRPPLRAHAMAAGVCAATAWLVVALAWARPAPRLGWEPLPAAVIAAVDRCPANLYNRYDDGGYFVWFTPGQRVFLDGRQDPYPVDLIRDHLVEERRGLSDEELARWDIRCAALPATSATAARLEQARGWREAARAGRWVVLERPAIERVSLR